MKIVFKYNLDIITNINLPIDAVILHVDIQKNMIQPQLWVLIDLENKNMVKRTFQFIPTGKEISNENVSFIGTIIMNNGLVFHLFEIL